MRGGTCACVSTLGLYTSVKVYVCACVSTLRSHTSVKVLAEHRQSLNRHDHESIKLCSLNKTLRFQLPHCFWVLQQLSAMLKY